MLDILRRQSALIYTIFGAIILIFAINFGPGSGGCASQIRPKQWVARVDGVAIGPELFGWTLERQYEDMRRRAEASGIKLDRVMAERFGIRRRVVDSLVDRRLIAAESLSRGISVSDARLAEELRDGYGMAGLSLPAYEDHVARVFNMPVEKFEHVVREDLASSLMMHALRHAIEVTDSELELVYRRQHERLQLRFAKIAIDETGVAEPGEQAVAALLEAEPSALQQEYDRNIQQFALPERVRLVQVVRTLDANAPAEAIEEARQALLAASNELKQGADGAAIVEKYATEPTTKAAHGDVGPLSREQLAEGLQATAFGMPVDSVTDEPMRGPKGLYILKKTEALPAGRKQLDEVRPELAARVLKGRVALAKAQKAADKLASALRDGGAFSRLTTSAEEEPLSRSAKAAQALANKPLGYETGWVVRTDESIARLGEAPDLIAAAFALDTPNAVLAPVRVEDALVVVQLKVREHAELDKLPEERDDLYESVVNNKQQRVLAAWLGQLRSQAKVDLNPAYLQPALPPEGEAPAPVAEEEDPA